MSIYHINFYRDNREKLSKHTGASLKTIMMVIYRCLIGPKMWHFIGLTIIVFPMDFSNARKWDYWSKSRQLHWITYLYLKI